MQAAAAACPSPSPSASACPPPLPPRPLYRLRHQLIAPQGLQELQLLLAHVSALWRQLDVLQTVADKQQPSTRELTQLLDDAAFSAGIDVAVLHQLQRVRRLLLHCDAQSAAAFDRARDDAMRLLNLPTAAWEDEQRDAMLADDDEQQQQQPSALLDVNLYAQSLQRAISHVTAAGRSGLQRTQNHKAMLQLIGFCAMPSCEEERLSSAAALSSVRYVCLASPSLSSSDDHLLMRCQHLSRLCDADDDELLLQLQSRSACRLVLQSLLVTISYEEEDESITEVRCYPLDTVSLAPLTAASVAAGELQAGAAGTSLSVSVERSQLLPRVSLLLSSRQERRSADGQRIAPQLTATCRYRTAAVRGSSSRRQDDGSLSSDFSTEILVHRLG